VNRVPLTSRKARKRSLTRILLALSAVIFAGYLAAASDGPGYLAAASEGAASMRPLADLGSPTNFDYLVLASIADSPHFLAMAGYRSIAMQRAELPPGAQLPPGAELTTSR
jgi:hypothetical protein